MSYLRDEDADLYKKQFKSYLANGIEAETMEAMYKKAHAAIRKDPAHKSTAKPAPKDRKKYNSAPKVLSQRKNTVLQKQRAFLKKQSAAEAADE